MAPEPLSPAEAAARWQALMDWLAAQREEAHTAWVAAGDAMHAAQEDGGPEWDTALREAAKCESACNVYNAALAKMREMWR